MLFLSVLPRNQRNTTGKDFLYSYQHALSYMVVICDVFDIPDEHAAAGNYAPLLVPLVCPVILELFH